MNLRVDLIYPNEQRSGGAVALKSVVRIGSVVIPCVLVLIVGWWVLGIVMARGELSVMEEQWRTTELRQQVAKQTANDLGANRKIIAEIEGWSHAAMPWHPQLIALVEIVPPEVQIVSATVLLDEPGRDEAPARRFALRIAGRTGSPQSKDLIETLRTDIEKHAAYTNGLDHVEVAHYGADESDGAGPMDRVFEIEVSYAKRDFK